MRIAVLSGKGGTGKTLVSVNLAAVAEDSVYMDCDVEGPNGHLYFKPTVTEVKEVTVKIPKVNQEQCMGCRQCVDFCQFNALAYVTNKLYLFDDICHGCGGCILHCPTGALSEEDKTIGSIQVGMSEHVKVYSGNMNIGEVSGVPIIRTMMKMTEKICNQEIIVDCSPGSACLVNESIRDADYCLIVAESTIFGAHNLQMVYELALLYQKKIGVILNKCNQEDNPAEIFCRDHQIPIKGKLPFDRKIARSSGSGHIIVKENKAYEGWFKDLLLDIKKEVLDETTPSA